MANRERAVANRSRAMPPRSRAMVASHVLERERIVSLLRIQADAITAAADRLDLTQFARAVRLLVECRGRVVTSGAGTSGTIARKVAGTLTSTGTPACFLHPSDALHGDLGIVDTGDVAVIISNSGETDELLALVPYLEQRQVPIIAIVGHPGSTLGRHARAVLDAFTEREACPFNLAPTASTSVALALGDALAMTVATTKGVTPDRFARNHPSGRIGKRLTLTVGEVMSKGSHPSVAPHASWLEVVTSISRGGIGAATVEDVTARLVGLITDGDLRRTIQRLDGHVSALRAEEFMTAEPVVVEADALAYDALRLMEDRPSEISVLPVLRDGMCLGLVRLHDLVQSGI